MLDAHQHGAAPFAADREALDGTEQDQEDRSEDADVLIRGQAAHEHGRRTHEQQRDDERRAPAELVADVAEDDAAERADEERDGERREGRCGLGEPVAAREEQRTEDEGGSGRVDVEAVSYTHLTLPTKRIV